MAANFLTNKDYTKLNSYPEDITQEDLIKYFTLTDEYKGLISQCREDFNRLGFAIQFCTLPMMGFVPDKFDKVNSEIISYLSQQLNMQIHNISSYGNVVKTKNQHLKQVLAYHRFKKFEQYKSQELEELLVKSAFYHNSPKALLLFALDWLHKEKIIRPGLIVLSKLVVKCLNKADKELMSSLGDIINTANKSKLDELLVVQEGSRLTKIGWLKDSATVINPEQILQNLEKLEYLQGLGVTGWKMPLSLNKIKKMYGVTYASSNHELMKMVEFRRYPVLTAFLSYSYTLILDETLDMFVSYIWDCHRKGNKAFEKEIREQYSSKLELIRSLKDICELSTGETSSLKDKYNDEKLETLISECEKYLRPINDKRWDFFAKRYGNIRRFLPKLLKLINFQSNEQASAVVRALTFIKKAD
ncbi:MAG: DUF4158 domain-containing protein, partial [Patescibacteria group bacterium]